MFHKLTTNFVEDLIVFYQSDSPMDGIVCTMQQYGDDAAVGMFIRGKGLARPSARVGSRPTLVVSLRYSGVPRE